jgi:GntP family gluconate:H+ symporter
MMVLSLWLLLVILLGILFIVFATAKLKLHPFLSLLIASFGVGIGANLPLEKLLTAISDGFGGLMGNIGIVIVAGTIIGLIMEKSGAALKMAEVVLRIVGEKHPQLAMSLIGGIVSIPVFCDSGYVILSSLKKSLARRAKVPLASMAVALATGLYATHTLVPPTPGPIAAAGNIGASQYLGTVILFGLIICIPVILVGYLWATKVAVKIQIEGEDQPEGSQDISQAFTQLPSTFLSFFPILLPLLLIGLGSVVTFMELKGSFATFLTFIGSPIVALLFGVLASFLLIPNALRLSSEKVDQPLTTWVDEAIRSAGPILLITGAGGAFGSVIKATPVANLIKSFAQGDLFSGVFFILFPFLIAAALKTAQGSSTAALVITSALMAPLLPEVGITGAIPLTLVVMAIGAGAMVVSHVNDSYFWVVTQFSNMKVTDAYKAQTMATLLQGVTAIIATFILWLIFV